MVVEKTLVLLKHDSVERGISGKILSRFEDTGLKIAGMKMVWSSEQLAKEHYPIDKEWAERLFEKTKKGPNSKPVIFKSIKEGMKYFAQLEKNKK